MKISVIGAGAWGTTIANLLTKNGHEVLLWVREKGLLADFEAKNVNTMFLPTVALSKDLKYTGDLAEAASFSDTIVMAIPVRFYRAVAMELSEHVSGKKRFINISKGIEDETLDTPTKIMKEIFGKRRHKYACLSGPNIAIEIAKEKSAKAVIASDDKKDLRVLQDIFENDYFRIYCSNDPQGVELGGALKNVIALAAGVCDGLGSGNNTKAAVLSRGLYEMIEVGKILGAKAETFWGLAGAGDLMVASFTPSARNRTTGELLGKGKTFKEATDELGGKTAEGAYTLKAVHHLAQKKGLDLPISAQMYKILYEGKDAEKAFSDIWKAESHEDACEI